MRKRLTVSRGLLLTVPREDIDDIPGLTMPRVGLTITCRIPEEFQIRDDDTFSYVSYGKTRQSTILRLNERTVDVRVLLSSSTYVRYRC